MKTARRALILVAVAILVWAAVQPLARTEWAESVRRQINESRARIPARRRREREERPPATRVLQPLVKDFVTMGPAALITLGALGLLRRRQRAEARPSL
jgi:MYXO-CTERM domain-containing protein